MHYAQCADLYGGQGMLIQPHIEKYHFTRPARFEWKLLLRFRLLICARICAHDEHDVTPVTVDAFEWITMERGHIPPADAFVYFAVISSIEGNCTKQFRLQVLHVDRRLSNCTLQAV